MNSVIEIHDSEIDAITNVDGEAVLYFSSVYLHKSLGKPGVDAGTGWVQKARLTIPDALVERTFEHFPAELLDGNIRLGDATFENEIPVPLHFEGDTEICLESWNDQIFLVSGRGAVLELIDEPTYVEDFQPAKEDSRR